MPGQRSPATVGATMSHRSRSRASRAALAVWPILPKNHDRAKARIAPSGSTKRSDHEQAGAPQMVSASARQSASAAAPGTYQPGKREVLRSDDPPELPI